MTTAEVRQKYIDFFTERGHKIIPRANLVPQDDPTTLFTGSGMQQLVPYFSGSPHPAGKLLVNSQPSFRAEDIDEVGDNRHTTFFEMLGNWSLGEYFKTEQLPNIFEFFTSVVGLDPKRLYVTVFGGDVENKIPRDSESADLWQQLFAQKDVEAGVIELGTEEQAAKVGMQGGRIFYYGSQKNWWSRSGPPANMPISEPGGPDSEVFYEFTEVEHDQRFGEHCHPNCDCGRFLEIGNSVFVQYVKTAEGFKELPQKNVDFGGGLERITAASIDNPDIFKIDILGLIIDKLESLSGKSYHEHTISMRVIADHLRAAYWLAVDGVTPSNNQQGYVMRRLMRRAIAYARDLEIADTLMNEIVPTIEKTYQENYKELVNNTKDIEKIFIKEFNQFRQTLPKGQRMLYKYAEQNNQQLSGEHIFILKDTYGFPVEFSLELASRNKFDINHDWKSEYDKLLTEQRERSRTAAKGMFKGGLADHSEITTKYHTATHLLYQALKRVLGEDVIQKGANITPERIRFDFTHPQKVTPEELKQVETIVNEQIEKDLPVSWEEYKTEEAFAKGAYGAFGDRYGDKVKVYSIGEGKDRFSFEICGGPHVEHTGQLAEDGKRFKITKEESSSAGVRRIKAVLQ